MARSSSSSDENHNLLKSEIENLSQRQNGSRKSGLTLMHFLVVALFSSAISIAASLIVLQTLRPKAEPSNPKELLPGFDIPPLGSLEKAFMPERVFEDPRSDKGYEAWMNLFPMGKGYISVDKMISEHSVPDFVQKLSTDGSGRFCIAAFHQLHCLYLLQGDLFEALEGNITSPRSHTLHCLDYLRESILCAADSTLEPFRSPFDSMAHRTGIDGYGTPHQCRDFNKLHAFAERYRYNDEKDFERFEG
ncbi:hypothetical protein F5884DRAFT_856986 [Xylogone sp. PMI_703]|nr:hypothetical protein F5884DRAFT_856986 [Xylogone sp. PMI_703]